MCLRVSVSRCLCFLATPPIISSNCRLSFLALSLWSLGVWGPGPSSIIAASIWPIADRWHWQHAAACQHSSSIVSLLHFSHDALPAASFRARCQAVLDAPAMGPERTVEAAWLRRAPDQTSPCPRTINCAAHWGPFLVRLMPRRPWIVFLPLLPLPDGLALTRDGLNQ